MDFLCKKKWCVRNRYVTKLVSEWLVSTLWAIWTLKLNDKALEVGHALRWDTPESLIPNEESEFLNLVQSIRSLNAWYLWNIVR